MLCCKAHLQEMGNGLHQMYAREQCRCCLYFRLDWLQSKLEGLVMVRRRFEVRVFRQGRIARHRL